MGEGAGHDGHTGRDRSSAGTDGRLSAGERKLSADLGRDPSGLVLLPQIDQPTVHEVVDPDDEGVRPIVVATPQGDVEVPARVGPARPDSTIELPQEQPGVAYLVEAKLLMQLPHRTELLTPAGTKMVLGDERPAEARDDEWVVALYSADSALTVVPSGAPNLSTHLSEEDWPEVRRAVVEGRQPCCGRYAGQAKQARGDAAPTRPWTATSTRTPSTRRGLPRTPRTGATAHHSSRAPGRPTSHPPGPDPTRPDGNRRTWGQRVTPDTMRSGGALGPAGGHRTGHGKG